jgi:N-acyl amino acid synthase of PEP-CTERM/exosortase system
MSIVEAFNQYFEIIPANSDALRQEVYKLRYQVYCIEKGFENPEAHPDCMEYDEYDICSSHYLIRHIESDCYMATTRLILPDHHNPKKLFPIETHSQINKAILKDVDRAHLAELSRFCVSKQFRRRANEQDLLVTNDDLSDGDFSRKKEKNNSANLTLALFSCGMKISAEHDIRYWYAIIEPALKRVVAGFGIHVIEIGLPIDFRGTRVPCFIKLDDMLNSVAKKNVNYWNMLTHYGDYQIKS